MMKSLFALILGLVLVGALFASDKKGLDDHKEKRSIAGITYEDLAPLVKDKKVFLIDCNSEETFAKGHIPGAVSSSASDFNESLPKDKGALIVAYCGGPKCSAWKSGATTAMQKGYTNVKHYSGGLKEWKEKGGELEAK